MSISGTTPVTAPLAPSSASDSYPTHSAYYGKGGHREVADTTERDNIPADRRTSGMTVYVINSGVTYILGPALTNGAWTVHNRGPQVVDSLSALAAFAGSRIPNATEFYVRCGTTTGDGREGDFYYDATSILTAVPGMVIVPADNNGRFLRKYNGEVNAIWFGAVPSQSTDSTTAIQAALWFAAKPTYGPQLGASSGYAALSVFIPPGEYKTTATLYNYGVRLYGKCAHYSGNYNADTVIHSKHSGHFIVFDYGGTNGPLGVADYRCGSLEDVIVEGYPETYPAAKVDISAVADRLNFTVAIGSLPTIDSVNPQMNVAFFYDNEGHYLGAGQISSVNGGTGVVTLVSGTDVYATVGGSVLRTVDKVVFTPTISAEGSVTNFADPASAGPCGVFMRCSYNGVGHGPTIKNVLLSNFHVALRVGPALLERRVKDLKIQACKYAGILYPREYQSTDSPYLGMTYITCGYRADYTKTFTNTIVNPQLCNTTVGWYGLGPFERVELVVVELASWAQMIIQRGLAQHITYAFLDLCTRHGLVVQRGYTTNTAASIYDNNVIFDTLNIRTPLNSGAKYQLDPIHGDRYAISVPNVGSSNPALLSISNLSINDGALGDFSHGIYTVAGVGNKVTISQVNNRWAAGTWYLGQAPFIAGIARNLTAAETYTGIAETATDELTVVNAAKSTAKFDVTGVTIWADSTGIPITLKRTDTTNAWQLVLLNTLNVLRFVNFNLGNIGLNVSSPSTDVSVTLGSPAYTGVPRNGFLYSEQPSPASGTDVAGADFYVISGAGTGNNVNGGAVRFLTANVTASGTTVQTFSEKFRILREGGFLTNQIASAPVAGLANGVIYADSTDKMFYGRINDAWQPISSPNKIGVSTITVDASATFTFSPLVSRWRQHLTSAITANRTVTLSTSFAQQGTEARFTRAASSTGAFNWDIGGLKNLTPGTWCQVAYDGSAWVLVEYGTL